MEILSLELSGFKDYEEKTSFNFQDKNKNLIFDIGGDAKAFLFESILGTIFGFTSEEKLRFRGNPALNKTYTALLTLALDQRTMIIERDFETDFVACLLSDTKTTRSIFQGKDFADNGFARPYMQMLRSVFPIIDKELFLDVCYALADENDGNFSDLLKILYSLLTPQFKFSNVKYLTNEALVHEQQYHKALQEEDSLSKYERLHESVSHMIKLKEARDNLEKDTYQLEYLIKKLQSRYNVSQKTEDILQQEYPTLLPFNPLQLRADLLIWRSLIELNRKNEQQLRDFALRRQHINNILKHDLYEYTRLPETFSKDAARYKERAIQLSYARQTHKDYQDLIADLQGTLNKGKQSWITAMISVPLLLFALSFMLMGPVWVFIIPETLLAFLILLFFSGNTAYKKRNQIYHYTEETHILEKRIHDAQEDINHLLKKSNFFKEPQFLDSHVQRFKKCLQYQRELKTIDREESKLREQLASESYIEQLEGYEKRYSGVVDIERRDLEEYLDKYVQTCQSLESKKQSMDYYPALGELAKLHDAHTSGVQELNETLNKIRKSLNISNGSTDLHQILDQLDRRIKNARQKQRADSFTALQES